MAFRVGCVGVARFLIDLCLIRQITFELRVSRKFELNKRFISGPSGHLVVGRTSTVVHLSTYIRIGGKPSETNREFADPPLAR